MITFGPVPSRRLGKSLGINNIIFPKTCPYSCIYCQVGRTTKKSIKREHFYKPEVIYESVVKHLNTLGEHNYPDYLTFVSNGEPTLDINLGRSTELLKKTGIPVAVITNASLLGDNSIRKDLMLSDLVSVKMDAGDNETWEKVNCPAPGLEFEKVTEGKNLFATEFEGILYTETMLVEGVNDFSENLINVAKLVHNLNPAKAYLSIPIRPPAGSSVKSPGPEKLNLAWQIFNDMNINTEFLTGFEGTDTGYTGNIYEDILNITAVHPLREDAMQKLLHNDGADYTVIDSLTHQRLIRSVIYEGKKFFLRDYHQAT